MQGQEFANIKQAAKHFGRSYTHIFERLKAGCTIEQALGLVKRTDTLQAEYPELAKQWHPTKNDPLTPEEVTYGSGIRVWWLCSEGHEWQAVINSRRQGAGCPYCAGQRPTANRNFATEYPELLKEWDWEKNSKMPEDFTPRSKSKVWWKCEKGHSWQALILNRTRDTKNLCPCCSNRKLCEDNSLAQLRPEIAKDWHPNKNAPLTPSDVIAGAAKRSGGYASMATNGKRQLVVELFRAQAAQSVLFRHLELKLLSIQNLMHCLTMLLGVKRFQVMNAIYIYAIIILVLSLMEFTGTVKSLNRI